MKKSKFITGLSAAFISAMALMSCSSLIKGKGHVVLTINGEPYYAEDLFADQKTPAAAEAKFNAVYKVAIRSYFKNHTEYDKEIENETKIKISEQKATAQSNADKNGTSYAVEWQKILDSNNVDDENGLYDKFEYDLQKEKFENNFYDQNYDKLRKNDPASPLFPVDPEHPDRNFVDYFTNKQPYHMKHILVKIAGLGNNNTDGTITDAEAEKLYHVITDLANGTPFYQVSKSYSDDEAAKEANASLGIMSRDTSFVDDFKLGTYFYEAFYGNSTVNPDVAIYDSKKAINELFKTGSKALDFANEIKTKVNDPTTSDLTTEATDDKETLGVIPYEAALLLGKKSVKGYADYEYEDAKLLKQAGISKSDFNNKYLPRNVIFNKFFNKHNIMVISAAHMPKMDLTYNTGIKPSGSGSYRVSKENYTITCDNATNGYQTLPGFNETAKNQDIISATTDKPLAKAITSIGGDAGDNKQHILRDENGRTIFVFRSGNATSSTSNDEYSGIHFVVIERSPFIGIEYEDNNDATENKYSTTLDEYYTVYYPGQSGDKHPKYKEGAGIHVGEDKNTYANYNVVDKTQAKKDRADKVKSELKNCMPNLNTFIYENLLQNNGQKIEFKDKSIEQSINDWIAITREDSVYEKDKNWDNNWQNYCYSLEAKTKEREDVQVGPGYDSRVVSQYCINAITGKFDGTTGEEDMLEAISHMFSEGGVFHE